MLLQSSAPTRFQAVFSHLTEVPNALQSGPLLEILGISLSALGRQTNRC